MDSIELGMNLLQRIHNLNLPGKSAEEESLTLQKVSQQVLALLQNNSDPAKLEKANRVVRRLEDYAKILQAIQAAEQKSFQPKSPSSNEKIIVVFQPVEPSSQDTATLEELESQITEPPLPALQDFLNMKKGWNRPAEEEGIPMQTHDAAQNKLPLLEPLTKREKEIITLLDSDRSIGELANDLFISRNTLKTHLRHLYSKLGVRSRSGLVAQARKLGLIA